jgi:hypothetical protein
MRFFTKLSFYVFLAAIFFHLLSFLSYLKVIPAAVGFFIILILGIFFSFRKLTYGWLVFIFELLIGHDGHLFEFKELSLRLVLFGVLMAIWLGQKILHRQSILSFKNDLVLPFLILLFFIIFGAWHGLIRNNPRPLVWGNIVNYSYFLFFLPLIELTRDIDFRKKLLEISAGAILALFCFSLITLFLFSSGILYVHEPSGYYWWFRENINGKITKMDFNFFRIVTPGHLIVLPIFLIYLSLLLTKELKKENRFLIIFLAFLSSFVILVNFSRAYLIGLIAGIIFLMIGVSWRVWLRFELTVIFLLIIEMLLILFFCSRFQPSSFNLLEERLSTLFGSEEELSLLTRKQRLIGTKNLLIQSPILGTGMGTVISFFDPNSQKTQITYHLDWGYLEIWLELSLFGLIAFLYFNYLVIKKIILLAKSCSSMNQRLIIGLGSGLISLIVATFTGPYLFHSLGISYLALVAALVD